MANSFMLEVVTPQRKVLSEDVEGVVVPASEGLMGVLADHAPMITGLTVGVVKFTQGGQDTTLAISGGFMEVIKNKLIMLVDTAELAQEIDVDRAKEAKERAQQRLEKKTTDMDFERAELALKRALARLDAIEKQ